MKAAASSKSIFDSASYQVRQWNRIQRKQKNKIKFKLYLTLVLPLFLVMLGIRVFQTLIQIGIRKTFSSPLPKNETEKTSQAVPATMEKAEMTWIHPD